MPGLFMPENYVSVAPSALDMNIASLVWGLSLCFSMFTFAKGARQTYGVWRRKRAVNAYVVMIWIEWLVCFLISVCCWFYLWGSIPPSFAFFFCLITLWVFQTQCIIQIIINRIALLVRDKTYIRRLQWGTIFLMGLINISVYCIWIPAQLQVNDTFIHVNFIWDRVGKVIFAVIDVLLNSYFIYLVRAKLISNGLTKYNRLFYFNMVMIICSLCLDVILIGTMSIGQGFIYVQFHPLVYGIKLHIEMNLADLIAKSVRGEQGSGNGPSSDPGAYYHHSSHGRTTNGGGARNTRIPGNVRMQTLVTGNRHDENDVDIDLQGDQKSGIHRTVETRIVHEPKEDDAASRTSSTEELQKKFGIV